MSNVKDLLHYCEVICDFTVFPMHCEVMGDAKDLFYCKVMNNVKTLLLYNKVLSDV